MNVVRTGSFVTALAAAALLLGLARPSSTRADDVKNPHGAFQEDCSLCHSPTAWVPARISPKFDHAKYGLALQGAHRETPCMSCHTSLDFSREQAACADCHQDVHEGELGSDCAGCHTTRSFIDRSRMEKMHQFTRFPLTGVHVTLDCMTCHDSSEPGNLTFVNLHSECVACHRAQYEAAVPDHDGNGFSQDCTLCHGTNLWSPAEFDHDGTAFPLTGAHRLAPCASCHGEGTFTKVDAACVSCHRAEYDATTDPSHVAASFPLECQNCHNTTSWGDANFDHAAWFPVDSGAHQGQWNLCSDCHIDPANYAEFTCLSCHPHSDEAKTLDGHQQVQNYAYESHACYTCHPQGRH